MLEAPLAPFHRGDVYFVIRTEKKSFPGGRIVLVATVALARFPLEMAQFTTCIDYKNAAPSPRISSTHCAAAIR
jgi:hypothetical protein